MYTNMFLQKCTNIPVKNKEIGTTGSTVHKSILSDMHMYVCILGFNVQSRFHFSPELNFNKCCGFHFLSLPLIDNVRAWIPRIGNVRAEEEYRAPCIVHCA